MYVCGDPCAFGGSVQVILTSIDANIGAISQAFSKHRHEVSLNTFSHTENNVQNNARNACHVSNVILILVDRMKIIDVYRRGADANLVNEE